MWRYLDWAQAVLRVVLRERPPEYGFGITQLAADLGLPSASDGNPASVSLIGAFDHVLTDLASHGFVIYDHNAHSIGYPPEARRFRLEPLSSTWHVLRSGYMSSEDEAFLAALARLSEWPGEHFADVVPVTVEAVFDHLGWCVDVDQAFAIFRHLKERILVAGLMLGVSSDIRITYAGLVRALDDPAHVLREAEDHIEAHRLRAAGCIAAVELERRLKQLVGRPPNVSHKRDPGLEDYNKAAYDSGLIDQEAWESIKTIAVIRKRCVHVLDREPHVEEVRMLLDGVERILRRYPSA
jgi:hypothetical protein